MNVALFGGTFDPVHLGHLAVARAAAERFQLKRIHFVPAWIPPHKMAQPVTAFGHRFAMLGLATAGEKTFIPSLLESPENRPAHGANYSIDTVRHFRRTLKPSDRLFFLIGVDAFLEIATWREPEALLREAEFIVVSRPGFMLGEIGAALPESLRPKEAVMKALRQQPPGEEIALGGATLHLLQDLAEKVSATQIRQAATRGRSLEKLVGPAVAEYIRKQGLYRRPALQVSSFGKAVAGPGGKVRKFHVLTGGKPHRKH